MRSIGYEQSERGGVFYITMLSGPHPVDFVDHPPRKRGRDKRDLPCITPLCSMS